MLTSNQHTISAALLLLLVTDPTPRPIPHMAWQAVACCHAACCRHTHGSLHQDLSQIKAGSQLIQFRPPRRSHKAEMANCLRVAVASCCCSCCCCCHSCCASCYCSLALALALGTLLVVPQRQQQQLPHCRHCALTSDSEC